MPKAKRFIRLTALCLSILIACFAASVEAKVGDSVKGRILLQAEGEGEIWYVYPPTGERHYLANADDAWEVLSALSLGISDSALAEIPIAKESGLPENWSLERVARELSYEGSSGDNKAPVAPEGTKEAVAAKPKAAATATAVSTEFFKGLTGNDVRAAVSSAEEAVKSADINGIVDEVSEIFKLDEIAASLNIDAETFKPLVTLVGAMSLILLVFGRGR